MKWSLRYSIILLLFWQGLAASAQPWSSLRRKVITLSDTVLHLDTLTIAPGTFSLISRQGDTLPSSLWRLEPLTAKLFLSPALLQGEDSVLLAVYRVFPFRLKPEYYDEALRPEPELKSAADRSYLYTPLERQQEPSEDFFSFGGLQRSGSISRAITVGTSQDAVLSSAMNLQLSGELAPGITVAAAITDNTIPIQPDGTSQQLREFDKVFIKASGKGWETTAGDFDITNGSGEYLQFAKKVKGAMYTGEWKAGKEWNLTSRLAGAVARGKYGVTRFNGTEGNQGPYQLRGANNENFIMVLAGSEKVYLDGRLLTRGANNDYVIDYNNAQITFTPRIPVTQDKRFEVSYEYAERYYNRTMVYLQQQATRPGVSLQFQYYREQDLRGQPLSQEQLIDDNRALLQAVGDSAAGAVVPNYREVPYNNSEVLYRRTDTLVNGTLYSPVFVYSNNPDSALWRLGFSYTGAGRGSYIQSASAANGRVFTWIAPVAGILQGDYEPVILLITPKTQQIATFSGAWKPGNGLSLHLETALSGNDLNTFSTLNDDDNTGIALTTGVQHVFRPGGDSSAWRIESGLLYRLVTPRFSAVERFREVEYERDWNITGLTPYREHQGKFSVRTSHNRLGYLEYLFEPMLRGPADKALRHTAALQLNRGKWALSGRASMLGNENAVMPATFFRHRANLSRKLGLWNLALLHEGESNRQYFPGRDSLRTTSFFFRRWQGSAERGDTAKLLVRISGGHRVDLLPLLSDFGVNTGSRASEVSAGIASAHIPNHRFDLNLGYRQLATSGISPSPDPEESLLGRAEYHHKLLKGLVQGSMFYEFGSGLEYRKEFAYLEVSPGQGIYTWKDFNGDSIKQLDEFEVAVFQDEANFVRIYTPTQQYERVYTMQYTQSLNIQPALLTSLKGKWGRFVSRFSDQGNYRIEQKVGGENLTAALDPFGFDAGKPDLVSLSYLLRNTLFFNRSAPRFGLDYTTAISNSKVLMVNGFELRTQKLNTLRGRVVPLKNFMLRTEGNLGTRSRSSEFFVLNNYRLSLWSILAELQYQPGTQYRASAKYQYSDKKNTEGSLGEKATLHRTGIEFRYNIPQKGAGLQAQGEWILIGYNASQQSSIAFEMLEGLSPGTNYTWILGYQQMLSDNLQIALQYNGRKSTGTPAVHTGNVQVRASF